MTDDEPRNVTKRDLVDRLADKLGVTKVLARDLTQLFIDEISDELARGSRIAFRDFGVFEVRVRAGRVGLNPRTLERVDVPPGHTVRFRVSRALRERISPDAMQEFELEGGRRGAKARRASELDHLDDDAAEVQSAPPRGRLARGASDDDSDDDFDEVDDDDGDDHAPERAGSKPRAARRGADASGAPRSGGRPRSGTEARSSEACDTGASMAREAEERSARSTPPTPPPPKPGSPF